MKVTNHAIRYVSFILAMSMVGEITLQPALAQDLKATGQELVLEEKWMSAFYDLEYAMDELMWHQSMSVLASYGGYNSYVKEDGNANANDLQRLKNRIDLNRRNIADFNRSLHRNASLPADDAERADNILALYAEFLAAAEEVAAFLDDDDPGAANVMYRDRSVPISKEIGANLFNLRRAAQDRFRHNAKNIR